MGVLKNDVGRPSNKTIMIRNILKLICILIIVGAAFGLGCYLKENSKAGDSKQKLTLDNKDVKKLFNTLNSSEVLDTLGLLDEEGNGYTGFFYWKDKTVASDVDDYIKFAISMNELYGRLDLDYQKDVDLKFYDAKKIDDKSIEIFGSKINDKTKLFYKDAETFKYSNGVYVYKGSAGVGSADGYKVHTKITSAYKEKDTIVITNKIMVEYMGPSETGVYHHELYKNIGKNNEVMDKIDEINDPNATADIDINKYIDKLNTYKWTFTKDLNGNYVFTSVEKSITKKTNSSNTEKLSNSNAEAIISKIFKEFPAFDEYGFPTTDSEKTNLAVLNTVEAPLSILDSEAIADLFGDDIHLEYAKTKVNCTSNMSEFECKKKYAEYLLSNNVDFMDKVYTYGDVKKTFDNMFASGNIDKNLTPENLEASPMYTGFSRKYNVFYNKGLRAGDAGGWIYGVIDSYNEGNKIYITTARYYAGPEEYGNDIKDYLNNSQTQKTKILIIEDNGTYKFDKVIK